MREHHRQTPARYRPTERFHPRHVDAEDFAVEEKQRAQHLTMRARGHMPLVGKHRQVALDVAGAEIARMPHASPTHIAADPVDVSFLGP